MLRPVPMTRALIVGPRDNLEATVENLYNLKLVHIVDHREGEEGLEIGRPLPTASEASEILVKLRSIASALQLEETKPASTEEVAGDLREKILSLELNISEEDAARKKTQALLQDLDRKTDEVRPFAQLRLSLADYRGYETVEVFVGKVAGEIEGLDSVTPDYEAFTAPGLLAVFVPKPQAAAVREFLTQRGFTTIPVPEGEGDPREILSDLLAERERWQARLEEVEKRLDALRERYAGFLSAARARLEVTVEKAEAPLRFAVTDHTFIVEGWVPTESFEKLEGGLGRFQGLYVTELEHDHAPEHAEESTSETDPPVLLRNAKPLRPFEMLVTLFSTPNYREIDPTFILTFTFPIFFGLMVGDAGYGIAWLAVGLWLERICRKQPGRQLFLGITASEPFRNLVIAITWGGFWSLLFGLFFFGEALGIPFHHGVLANSRVELLDWSAILGFNIPLHAQLEKLDQVTDFIVLSIVAAYVHLAIAYVVGFINDVGHNKRHALGKISWLLILTGFFVVMISRSARWPVGPEGRTPYGYFIWTRLLSWFPRDGYVYASIGFGPSNPIPWLAVGMLVGGIALLVASEGFLHLMEFFGLLANIVSYARLAAVGVAKAAMAFAFNVIVLETMIFPGLDSGNIAFVILGLVAGLALGFVFHAIVFVLGAVSAAIQAIRLNYVEFFIKFFKGAGRAFRPFGERAKPEV